MTGPAPSVVTDIFCRVLEPNGLEWRPFRQGVDIYPIQGDIRGGCSSALLRYQPGARVPAHFHTGHEYLLVLSGSQSDGSRLYRPGSLVVNFPGSTHAISSEEGCIVLLIWEKPVRFDGL